MNVFNLDIKEILKIYTQSNKNYELFKFRIKYNLLKEELDHYLNYCEDEGYLHTWCNFPKITTITEKGKNFLNNK